MNRIITPDWKFIEDACRTSHGCSEARMAVMGSIRSRNKQFREAQKKQKSVSRVVGSVKKSLEANPLQTKEELTKSVLGLLAPFFIQWLISLFERKVLDWILYHLDTEEVNEP